MLPSTPQVEAVYLDPTQGILPGLLSLPANIPSLSTSSHPDSAQTDSTLASSASGPSSVCATSNHIHTLLIDQTTLDPTVAVSVAKRIQDETGGKALMMDAPVSGGKWLLKYNKLTQPA